MQQPLRKEQQQTPPTPNQAFDLGPWRARLEAIRAERDARRMNTTLVLLNEARQPVPRRA